MASILTNANTFLQFAASAWRNRGIYASLPQAGKALMIRMCFTNIGRKLVADRVCTLRLRGMDQPIHVRRCQSDFMLVQDIFQEHEYAGVREWGLPADASIVDLGANVGLASLYLSTLFPQGRIAAVEPDRGNLSILRMNCAELIQQGRMTIFEGFIAANDGVAGIDRSVEAMGFSKIALNSNSAETINCISMPTLITKTGVDRIDLLKCDIEGGEVELFKAAHGWINRVRHMVVEVHPPYTLDEMYADLRAAGWQFRVTRAVARDKWWVCFLQQA